MTAVQTDSDHLQHLDFTPDCQNVTCWDGWPPATHIVGLICGCTIPCCTPCADNARQMRTRNRIAKLARCNNCGATYTNIRECQLYVSIKPI